MESTAGNAYFCVSALSPELRLSSQISRNPASHAEHEGEVTTWAEPLVRLRIWQPEVENSGGGRRGSESSSRINGAETLPPLVHYSRPHFITAPCSERVSSEST